MAGLRPHLVGERRRFAIAAVAGGEQGSADDFLVEALRFLAGREPRLVGLADPVARRVRCVHLVDQQQAAVGCGAELVLGVGKDQAGLGGLGLAPMEQHQRCLHHLSPSTMLDEPSLRDLGDREREVVHAFGALRRRCDERPRQHGVLPQTVRESMAVDVAGTIGVLLPQRGGRDPGDVPAHDHLDRQGRRGSSNEHVRVGQRQHVVGHDVGRLREPPRGELVQHLTLVGNAGDDAVERRQPVGGDEEPARVAGGVVAELVRHAHLAVAAIG